MVATRPSNQGKVNPFTDGKIIEKYEQGIKHIVRKGIPPELEDATDQSITSLRKNNLKQALDDSKAKAYFENLMVQASSEISDSSQKQPALLKVSHSGK